MKHTPGPWSIISRPGIARVSNYLNAEIQDEATRSLIAEVDTAVHAGNARLIAAAPEMYSFLLKHRDAFLRFSDNKRILTGILESIEGRDE